MVSYLNSVTSFRLKTQAFNTYLFYVLHYISPTLKSGRIFQNQIGCKFVFSKFHNQWHHPHNFVLQANSQLHMYLLVSSDIYQFIHNIWFHFLCPCQTRCGIFFFPQPFPLQFHQLQSSFNSMLESKFGFFSFASSFFLSLSCLCCCLAASLFITSS